MTDPSRLLKIKNFSPEEAYAYALAHCHEQIPEIEAILKNHAAMAYKYAMLILHRRWLEAEGEIAKYPDHGYYYALEVIRGRFPEAEAAILTDPEFALYYATRILKRRWIQAEPIIIKYVAYAFQYLSDVVKNRWPEAEDRFRNDWQLWEQYINHVKSVLRTFPMQANDIKWAWIQAGISNNLVSVLNAVHMDKKMQEYIIDNRPDLIGEIKDLDPYLAKRYQEELTLSGIEI
jgi:hypothetical protein